MTGFMGVIPRIPAKDTVAINGVKLSEIGAFVKSVDHGNTTPDTTFRTAPGLDGAYDVSLSDDTGRAFTARRTITLTIGVVGLERDAIKTMCRVAEWHGVEGVIQEQGLPGAWHGRMTVGAWTMNRTRDGVFTDAECQITVSAEPFLVGDAVVKTLEVAGGGSLFVRGNVETWPIIRLTTKFGSKLTVTRGSRQMNLPPAGNNWAAGVSIVIDAKNGYITQNGNPYYLLDIRSDWINLLPGKNTIMVVGASKVEVEYTPLYAA